MKLVRGVSPPPSLLYDYLLPPSSGMTSPSSLPSPEDAGIRWIGDSAGRRDCCPHQRFPERHLDDLAGPGARPARLRAVRDTGSACTRGSRHRACASARRSAARARSSAASPRSRVWLDDSKTGRRLPCRDAGLPLQFARQFFSPDLAVHVAGAAEPRLQDRERPGSVSIENSACPAVSRASVASGSVSGISRPTTPKNPAKSAMRCALASSIAGSCQRALTT